MTAVKLLGVVVCLYLSACGGGGSGATSNPTSPANPQPTLSSITVTPASVTLIAGQTQQLTATAKYSDGSTKDLTSAAVWSSSNAAVATVSASGLVSGVTAGQSSISATSSSVTGLDALTVNAKTYSIGGTISGLTSTGLALEDNGGDNLNVPAGAATFTFPTAVASGGAYNVTVLTQPVAQICTVGSGNGTAQSANVTTVLISCTPDLKTTTTITAADSTVPTSVVSSISEVDSSADSEVLGQPLAIPTDSTGFATPIFAVDSGENMLLAAYANSGQTTFSATSTATTLVILTIGSLPDPGPSFAQVAQDVQSAAGFANLVTDIQTSLAADTSPLNSQAVVQDVATVVNQVLPVIASQSTSKTNSGVQAQNVTIQPTEFAAQPLPFQILGPIPSRPTFSSVYIASATTQGVNLINTMPIQLHASSTDLNAKQIDPGKILPAADGLVAMTGLASTPNPVSILGNGQQFMVSVDMQGPPVQIIGSYSLPSAQGANLQQDIADWIIFAVGRATNLNAEKLPGLPACAKEGSAAIINAVVGANTTIFVSTATGAQIGSALAKSLTVSLLSGTLKTVISCAAPSISTSSVAAAAIANLAKFLAPYSAVWKSIEFAADASGPATETALTYYYWNISQPVQVCEAGGAVVSCLPSLTVTVTWTVASVNIPNSNGWDGTDTLTVTNGNAVYTGNLSTVFLGCVTTRTESGSGTIPIPVTPTPAAPFEFVVQIGASWTNTQAVSAACAALNGSGYTYSGSTNSPSVTIQATPAPGGYSLSTNTVYPQYPYGPYGGSTTTVTASGFLSVP